ncbi:MAG: DUF2066 domain-containing protein [Pseudomonadota bacterium]|nr:DUF2066 domain-containing protein [Pseudomonadota bacterium]
MLGWSNQTPIKVSSLILLVILFLGWFGHVLKAENAYKIDSILVDHTAVSAEIARELALKKGRLMAFQRLIERIVPEKETEKLPQIGEEKLEELVAAVQIEDEKSSQIRYIASLNIIFSSSDVRRYLHGLGVGFAESFSKPLLVLPIFRERNKRLLWESENPWRKAWEAQSKNYSLLPLKIPAADIAFNRIITAKQAMEADKSKIAEVFRNFSASGLLLLSAEPVENFRKNETMLQLTIRRIQTGLPDYTEVRSIRAPKNSSLESILARAIKKVARDLSEKWKKQNVIRFRDRGLISAMVYYDGLSQWVSIQKKLALIASIYQIEISNISKKQAGIKIHFFGRPEQLGVSFVQQNLDLFREVQNWGITLLNTSGQPTVMEN